MSLQNAVRVALALIVFVTTANAQAQDGVKTITLGSSCFQFAFDPHNGVLAGVRPDSEQIVIYPKIMSNLTGDGAKTLKMESAPVHIVWKDRGKDSVFVALLAKADKIVLIDPKSLAVVKSIALKDTQAHGLFVSDDPNDPHVYYLCHPNVMGRIRRVHLDKQTDEAVGVNLQATTGAVTADGKLLYSGWFPFQPTAIVHELLEPTADRVVPTRILFSKFDQGNNFNFNVPTGYLADPLQQYVVWSKNVYTPDLKEKLGTMSFTPTLISRKRPTLYGFDGAGFVAASANTFENLGRIASLKGAGGVVAEAGRPVPFEKKDSVQIDQFGQIRIMEAVNVFEDATGAKVLICRRDKVHVVDFKAFDAANEPFMTANVTGSKDALIGQAFALTVKPVDPAVSVGIEEGRPGMMIDEEKITWMPTGKDVGSHRVVLILQAGKLQKKLTVQLTVRPPSLALPFLPGGFHVSESTMTAVCLKRNQANFNQPFGQQPATDSALAVIDLKGLKITAEKKFNTSLNVVAMDAHYVYAGLTDSDALYVLDRKDLSQVKRIFTNGRVNQIVPVADRLLFVRAQGQNQFPGNVQASGDWMVLTVPDLKAAANSDVGTGVHLTAKGQAGFAPTQVGSRWLYQGILYDAAFRKAEAVLNPLDSLTQAGRAFNDQKFGPGFNQPPPDVTPWGVHLQFQNLMQGRRVLGTLGKQNFPGPFQGNSFSAAILTDQPVAAALQMTQEVKNNESTQKIVVRYHDLHSADILGESLLMNETVPQQPGVPFNQFNQFGGVDQFGRPIGTPLHECQGQLVALFGQRVYVINPPRFDPKKAAVPMHFETKTSVLVADKADTVLPLPNLLGQAEEVDFALRQEQPGIDLDAKKRALIVDAEAMRKHILTQFDKGRRIVVAKPGSSAQEEYFALKQRHTRLFEALVGRKPVGMPLWHSVTIVASDKNLQEAVLTLGFFVEVPEAPLLEGLKKADAVGNQPLVPGGDPNRLLNDMARRINMLQEQVERLQLTVDQLNRRLGGGFNDKDVPKDFKK